jgi:SAM-dependent methyltransferase
LENGAAPKIRPEASQQDIEMITSPEQRSARELNRHMSALLAKVGIDKSFFEQRGDSAASALSSDARNYLRLSNPRLRELEKQFTEVSAPCIDHTQWNSAYVAADVPLDNFRGDCAFVWQRRDMNCPANYVVTSQYQLANGFGELLDHLPEDRLFGVYAVESGIGLLTRDRLDAASEITFLEHHLQLSRRKVLHVLDIGAGYGRFAHRLLQYHPTARVTCVDAIARAAFLCEFYLTYRGMQHRSAVIPLNEILTHDDLRTVDVAVNIHSFSECPLAAIEWWLAALREMRIPYLMIVPNAGRHGGRRLLSKEKDGTKHNILPAIEKAGYRQIALQPKYLDSAVQQFGISPTHYHLFTTL